MPLLELHDISVSYGRVQALREVSLHIGTGEVVALLGSNGAGKSTTLKTISGMLRCHPGGQIVLDGGRIDGMSPEGIVRHGVAHVPEGRRIFPGLSVVDNLLMGASNRGRVGRRQLQRDLAETFEIFPALQSFRSALGWTLSGGQQQMLALGRGLMSHPRLLLLDEPSLGLAPIVVDQVFAAVGRLRQQGSTILLVEQNASIALSNSDRAYVLETGRVVLEGASADLLGDDNVRHAYLGITADLEQAATNRRGDDAPRGE